MQIGEDINLHLSEKFCYGSDRRNLHEMALNLRFPIKMTLTGAKGTVLIFSHTYGTYHLWGWVMLSIYSTRPIISGINSQSHFIYIFACVQRWLLICVDNRSSVQMNTCDQRTTSNLWNRKARYDFILKVQISDSQISSGFEVIL